MNGRNWLRIVCVGGLMMLAAAAAMAFGGKRVAPVVEAKVLNTFDHDAGSFVQGLAIEDGQMWEGSGQYGYSSLRKVDFETGRIQNSVPLGKDYFGEGITLLRGKIYQLTWRENVCFVYDQKTLQRIGAFKYTGEGWGLANDGTNLYLSDGSLQIRVIEPEKFTVVRKFNVQLANRKDYRLNELEMVHGELWANVWYSDKIARIAPATGEVVGWLDASQLWPQNDRPSREHVLNGIAFDSSSNKLYLTGKNWPKLFEIALPSK
jgi:glutamine cyclotransferase